MNRPLADGADLLGCQTLIERWRGTELAPWAETLAADVAANFRPARHGDLPNWLAALASLPELASSMLELNAATVRVGAPEDCDAAARRRLEAGLQALHPWRKGPFELFGARIDTEWRSDWKWNRLKDAAQPLHGRRVLDVGCGSGYHCWRMRGAGAAEVIGIDPAPLFIAQFLAVQKYIADDAVRALPLGIEQVPPNLAAFDTVFSMGVLHHRRAPARHLEALRGCLRAGGELVLETLALDGSGEHCLQPEGRYAQMSNVRFIPTCALLLAWLRAAGFRNPKILDLSTTTTQEQRSTPWMRFHSLAQFLNPADPTRTIEGHPAPKRALALARK